MATFIPERAGSSNARTIAVKTILKTLDDSYVIRTTIRSPAWAPDYFIEHAAKGWGVLCILTGSFSDLVEAQLFESESPNALMLLINNLRSFGGALGATAGIRKLVVLWDMGSEAAKQLNEKWGKDIDALFIGKDLFAQHVTNLVPRELVPLTETILGNLRAKFFPESEIHSTHTTRRHFGHDTSAKLPRFFLDQEQEIECKKDIDIPDEHDETAKDFSVRLINGVAGSGKTLIEINRALILAEKYPDLTILMLILNKPVVADIKYKLRRTDRLPDNLDVRTFASWMSAQSRKCFRTGSNFIYDDDLLKHIKILRMEWPALKLSDKQLLEELVFIDDAIIADESAYLVASRAGRGFSLRNDERMQIWHLRDRLAEMLKSAGQCMWSAPARAIALADAVHHDRLQKYRHILIDEAQFFAPSWFEVVKLSLEKEGQLFLCADPNQGFLKSRLSWKSVGLDVRGRTKKLRKSYRTTKEILSAANRLLAHYFNEDVDDYLTPDFDGMPSGEKPELVYVERPQDLVDQVTNEISKALANDALPVGAVLVLYGDIISGPSLYKNLGSIVESSAVWWFGKADAKVPPHGYGQEYLRMANINTATGLEAAVVFLVGVENLIHDADSLMLDEEEREEILKQNVRKLYMAMTRAGKRLVVIAYEKFPPFVEELFDVCR